MLRTICLIALALSGSALAATTTYVYPVGSVKTLTDGTVAITTPRGLTVYVNCEKLTFDDSTHDWVSGFATKSECERFVMGAKKNIGHSEIELSGRDFGLRITH